MAVHVFLLIYVSVLGLIVFHKKPYSKRKNIWFVVLSFAAVFFVQSLRGDSVGLDTDDYTYAFWLVKNHLYTGSWEFLSFKLMQLTAVIFENPQVFLAVCSFIILYGVGIFIVKNTDHSDSTFWPVFLFIVLTQYFSTMNLLRQSLAMAVGCNIYTVLRRGINRRNLILSLILLIAAFMFHKSGIVCALLIIPFLSKLTKRSLFSNFLLP